MDHNRDRISNPNFSASSHASPSYSSYQSSTAQPPPQQPPFDPFARPEQRRDPFMPASFGSRRNSLTNNGGLPQNSYSSRDASQPASQRPPSPFRPGHSSSYSSDRRNSLGGSLDSGPPPSSLQHPSSLLTRHMPPPSASPKHSPSQSYSSSSMRGPLPSPGSRPRDPPSMSSNHRSSGNMSIQSLMASDTGPGSNPPSWSNGPGRSSSASYNQPPSPLERRFGPKQDIETEPSPHTPIRRPDGPAYAPYERRDTSVTSPPAATTSTYQPPDRGAYGFSRLLQPVNTSNESNGVPSRPYSQPSGADPSMGHPGPVHYESRQGPGQREDYGGGTFEKAVRDRSLSDLDGKKGSLLKHEYSRPAPEPFSPTSGPPQPIHASYQPRAPEYRDPLVNGGGARRDLESGAGRLPEPSPNESNLSYPGQLSSLNGAVERPPYDRGVPPSQEQSAPQPSSYYSSASADSPVQSFRRYNDGQTSRTPPIDAQLRKSIEESNRQSFPRFASDFNRRPDRSSPLPQAVQGAQTQPAGSGRDPGIKSEFGRMFSGLGSGVGSTPQPIPPASNGAPTPNRRSPEEELGDFDPFVRRNLHETSGSRGAGAGSRGGRRGGKRQLAENGRRDSDSGDGRTTPAAGSTRGAKANRYMHSSTGHHHHHHPQGPHHHHHHRKADENVAFPQNRRTSNTTHAAAFRFPTPGPTPNNSSVPHHHHHHHHAVATPVPHHHHLPPKQMSDVRVKRPATTISTSPLLRSVSHLPRRHLGSQLYAPTLSVPGTSFNTVDSPTTHQTAVDPNPLPVFDRSKVNSTFSIRVPRYYLTDAEREKICKARRVWGTDVYTDDSDPLAAAFHAGWIRGAWAGDVDLSIVLGINSTLNGTSNNIAKTNGNAEAASSPELSRESRPNEVPNSNNFDARPLTAPPAGGPLPPPPNLDLHLTLLLLPPLEKYTGSVWHGIRSRSWGGNHDGLSFKIDKVEWVDEGESSRWEERGLGAKKRRVRETDPHSSVLQATISSVKKRRTLGTVEPSPLVGTMRASRIGQVTAA